MKNTSNKKNKPAENILKEAQQKTEALGAYNDELENQIKILQQKEVEETQASKKSELSESLQIANDSKILDEVEKDFDKALIDIYADVADKAE